MLNSLVQQNPELVFPVLFASVWLLASTVISVLSGWYSLMRRFPDQPGEPILALSGQSGTMGIVGMRGIPRLSVCPAGLRVGIMRLFGPFSATSSCLGTS